jgi:hypothetical protein
VNNVRQIEIRTAEPLAPEPSAFEFEMTIGKLKSHKSPGIDQIPAELIKTEGRAIRSEIRKHVYFIWNKEELPEDCSKYGGISFFQLSTKFFQHPALKINSICRGNSRGPSVWISKLRAN